MADLATYKKAGEGEADTATPPPELSAIAPKPQAGSDLLKYRAAATPQTPRPAVSPTPERRLPTTFGEEIVEYPKLLKQASTENFHEMTDAAKEMWKHHTILGHAWQALRTLGAGAMYVASPIQAAVELAAEPIETYGEPFAALLTGGLSRPSEPKKPSSGLAHKIGEYGSIASQFVLDPLAAVGPAAGLGKATTALWESKLGQGLEKAFSASTRTTKVPRTIEDPFAPGQRLTLTDTAGKPIIDRVPQAAEVSRVIVRRLTERGLSGAQARESLEKFQKVVAGLNHDDRMAFNYHMDGDPTAAPLRTGLQPLADELRKQIDLRERRLLSIGALQQASGTYWPRMFKDPAKAESDVEAFQARQAQAAPRRPMQGSKRAAGLLKRTVPTMRESIERGMELVTDNPIEMALLRMQGMDHYYYGTLIGRELKKLPYLKFYRWSEEFKAGSAGFKPMDDKFFEARLPPAEVTKEFTAQATHREGFDPQLRKGVEDVARFLGLNPSRPLASRDPTLANTSRGEILGYATRGGKLVSRFGNNETTMMHEIGHHINFQYHLSTDMIRQAPKAWAELKDLALARSSMPAHRLQQQDPAFYAYLIDEEERIANLFHAYWHAPQLLDKLAPAAKQYLEAWLKKPANKGLEGVVHNVRPGVIQATDRRVEDFSETFHQYFPGLRYLGRWYAPEPVARVFNNFVSPGRVNNDLADVLRRVGNTLNMMQLSFSAFHLSMVSTDSAVSALAQLPSALRQGNLRKAADIMATQIPGVGQIYSGIRQTARGQKLRAALLNPNNATPELQSIINAFMVSGGRVSMDMMYRSNGLGGFMRSIRGGYFTSTIKDTVNAVKTKTPVARQVLQGAAVAQRALETSIEPLMESFVPRVKLGVFHDMAADWIAKNPHATQEAFVEAMQKHWDSVDNRLGEMVYDNLFWSKTLKDMAFLFVRAVGWNLGTEREIGGGIVDAIKSGHAALTGSDVATITERTKYTIALPITIALQGAMLNYLYTGHGPREILDYFYPRTGRTTPDGTPERVSIPSYVKDVFSYNQDVEGTVLNKLHPVWETLYELNRNKDYYGGAIRSELDPTWQPVQVLGYLLRQMEPFGFRGIQRQMKEGADWFPLLMSEFGFVPAPVSITNPKKVERYQQTQDLKDYRSRIKERLRGQ